MAIAKLLPELIWVCGFHDLWLCASAAAAAAAPSLCRGCCSFCWCVCGCCCFCCIQAVLSNFPEMVHDLKDWLGDQWATAWACVSTGTPLNFVETYVGVYGRATAGEH